MSGPPPKLASLRQRTNKKSTNAILDSTPSSEKVPVIPNPDGRTWHALTVMAWKHAWASPMASQWLVTDEDALGRLAVLWDEFYKAPDGKVMAEIRLQEQRFGLSPLDRSRLQWEVSRADEAAERKRPKAPERRTGTDPRNGLMAVK